MIDVVIGCAVQDFTGKVSWKDCIHTRQLMADGKRKFPCADPECHQGTPEGHWRDLDGRVHVRRLERFTPPGTMTFLNYRWMPR